MGATQGRAGSRRAVGFGVLCASLLLACSAESGRPERRHASFEAYLAERPEQAPRRRLVVIGLDGASWDYLEPQLAAGRLPALARVVREGAVATLRSVECYFTPPAWTTLFTGVLPARHGVYSFGRWDPRRREFDEVSAADVQAPPLWELASRAGLRVASVGVPVTYPAAPLEGVMVSGLMTPKRHGPPLELVRQRHVPMARDPELASHSPVLAAAFEDRLNVFRLRFSDGVDDGETRYDRVHLEVLRKGSGPPGSRSLGRYAFPLGSYSPWLRVRVHGAARARDAWTRIRLELQPDGVVGYQLAPTFERIRGPFTWPAELAPELERRFGYYLPHEFLPLELLPALTADAADHGRWFLAREPWDVFLQVFGQSDNAHHLVGFAPEVLPVYREIDAFLGEVLAAADGETRVALVSDHGFGSFDFAVDPNQLLARRGLLRWSAPGEIDFEHSLVFHNLWHLHFEPDLLTRAELRARAVPIDPGEEPRDALVRYLTRTFRELRSEDGTPFPIEVVPLPPDAIGDAPDMAVHGSDRFWIEFWNVDRPSGSLVRPLVGEERWKHARDGILAVWGPGVAAGRDLGALEIQDVVPTLLDWLGLPVADDLDGAPIAGLLAPEAARGPLERVASYGPRTGRPEPAPRAKASFAEMLRALGYVRD
jgi:predicted AlkP superfamily phosphohydrolase/phosphomutase